MASLTLFILLLITAEGDCRLLRLARFVRCDKTVITSWNWRLSLTCYKNKHKIYSVTKMRNRLFLQQGSSKQADSWPCFDFSRPLVGAGVRVTVFSADTPAFWFSSSISGLSTFSSPRVWTAVRRCSNSSTWAWKTKLTLAWDGMNWHFIFHWPLKRSAHQSLLQTFTDNRSFW